MLLPGAGRLPAYSLNPNTYLDIAVDELGLWIIHADPDYAGNLVITKLDPGRHSVTAKSSVERKQKKIESEREKDGERERESNL